MGTKEQVLALFENHKGVYFSGEDIAKTLSISRTAVWKSVKALQNAGYNIDAVRNKGYCLSMDTDILSVQGIEKNLEPIYRTMKIHVLHTVSSTNTEVRKRAMAGEGEGYVVIANSQTDGRGRSGRSFFSPSDTGIYMSLLLRPNQYSSQQAIKLTTMAAVAACEAIEGVSGKKAQIKWVNDIFVEGKKVCGILTEGSFGLEDGFLEYAVLGIGVNVFPPKDGFPNEIKEIAGTVFDTAQNDGKNHLAAEIMNRFMNYYLILQDGSYVDAYRRRSMVIGKEIQVVSARGVRDAIALDVDEECRLIVKYEDGKIEHLNSGEISIKVPVCD